MPRMTTPCLCTLTDTLCDACCERACRRDTLAAWNACVAAWRAHDAVCLTAHHYGREYDDTARAYEATWEDARFCGFRMTPDEVATGY